MLCEHVARVLPGNPRWSFLREAPARLEAMASLWTSLLASGETAELERLHRGSRQLAEEAARLGFASLAEAARDLSALLAALLDATADVTVAEVERRLAELTRALEHDSGPREPDLDRRPGGRA